LQVKIKQRARPGGRADLCPLPRRHVRPPSPGWAPGADPHALRTHAWRCPWDPLSDDHGLHPASG